MHHRRRACIGLAALIFLALIEPSGADVLYRFRDIVLFDGAYGPIARAQAQANVALMNCSHAVTITVDGRFGPGTRRNLVELARCPAFSGTLAADVDAQAGTLTT